MNEITSNTKDISRNNYEYIFSVGVFNKVLKIIEELEFNNSVYLKDFNFDDKEEFFINIKSPYIHETLKSITRIYRSIKKSCLEELLFDIIEIMSYKDIQISERVKKYVMQSTVEPNFMNEGEKRNGCLDEFHIEKFLALIFKLKSKKFVLERIVS